VVLPVGFFGGAAEREACGRNSGRHEIGGPFGQVLVEPRDDVGPARREVTGHSLAIGRRDVEEHGRTVAQADQFEGHLEHRRVLAPAPEQSLVRRGRVFARDEGREIDAVEHGVCRQARGGGGTVVMSGGNLQFAAETYAESITLSGAGSGAGASYGALNANVNGGATVTFSGSISLNGNATIAHYGGVDGNVSASLMTFNNGISGTGDLTLRSSAANNGRATITLSGQSTYAGDISGSGLLRKFGAGTVKLTGSHSQ